MNVRKGYQAILSGSFCLGMLLGQPLHARSIGVDEYPQMQHRPEISFTHGDESPANAFGMQISQEAKHQGLPEIVSLPENVAGANPKKVDWNIPNGKWENQKAHENDDKWENHKNGFPGPLDNPGYYERHDIDPPAAVPLPAAVWLLGSGLLGMSAIFRRRRTRGGVV
jgi:hypothetical protein